jgi:hypothetical protein
LVEVGAVDRPDDLLRQRLILSCERRIQSQAHGLTECLNLQRVLRADRGDTLSEKLDLRVCGRHVCDASDERL